MTDKKINEYDATTNLISTDNIILGRPSEAQSANQTKIITANNFQKNLVSFHSLTISSGTVTITNPTLINIISVDTENGDPADDLDNVLGSFHGSICILHVENSSRVVTVKDGSGIASAGDFAMDFVGDRFTMSLNSNNVWYELSRSNNYP